MRIPSSTIDVLELQRVTKSFPGVIANNDISLLIRSGEVLGLLGENGAGKTTLMNILYGIHQPDRGTILVNGRPVRIRSSRDAIRLGIGMVHQHFMLIPNHTVAENIALGHPATPLLLPLRRVRQAVAEYSRQYGLEVDPAALVQRLSASEKQRVEITKALFRGASLLILDEPTSVLSPTEIDGLLRLLWKMRERGHAIIFITHKLDEILAIADRITVLRQGRVVGTIAASQADKPQLAEMMVGRRDFFQVEKVARPAGPVMLEVANLRVRGDLGGEAVRGVSFQVRQGEILGIAGVSGNGQQELAEAITGLRRPSTGTLEVKGTAIGGRTARFISQQRVAHIPEERHRFGVIGEFTLCDNAALREYYRPPFSRRGLLNYAHFRTFAARLIKMFQVQAPSVQTRIATLSGGNIQKLILGRELSAQPILIVAAHPTYGLDIGAIELIRLELLKQQEAGTAILLLSENLEEILQLSDQIAVMHRGQIMGIIANDGQVNIRDIGLMMMGTKRSENPVTNREH